MELANLGHAGQGSALVVRRSDLRTKTVRTRHVGRAARAGTETHRWLSSAWLSVVGAWALAALHATAGARGKQEGVRPLSHIPVPAAAGIRRALPLALPWGPHRIARKRTRETAGPACTPFRCPRALVSFARGGVQCLTRYVLPLVAPSARMNHNCTVSEYNLSRLPCFSCQLPLSVDAAATAPPVFAVVPRIHESQPAIPPSVFQRWVVFLPRRDDSCTEGLPRHAHPSL